MKIKFIKRKVFGILLPVVCTSFIFTSVVSCGAGSPHSGDLVTLDLNGKTVKKTIKDFRKDLKKTTKADKKLVEDIYNKSKKYLYKKEQRASETWSNVQKEYIKYKNKGLSQDELDKKIKDANIKALDTEEKIRIDKTAEFADIKEDFKSTTGYNWKKPWEEKRARDYGSAKTDDEAIEFKVVETMAKVSFLREKLVEDETFTKEQVEWGNPDSTYDSDKKKNYNWLWNLKKRGFIWSPDSTKTYSQLSSDDNVVVLTTKSFILENKDPKKLVSKYLDTYTPLQVNHFLLPVIPDQKNALGIWKIKDFDSLEQMFGVIPDKLSADTAKNGPIIDRLSTEYAGCQWNNEKRKYESSKLDTSRLNKASGNSEATIKTGGSLGVMDELGLFKTMVPGFSMGILNSELKDKPFSTISSIKNPLLNISYKIINAIYKAGVGVGSGIDQKTWDHNKKTKTIYQWYMWIHSILKSVNESKALEISGRVFRDSFRIDNGTSNPNWKRSIVYDIPNSRNKIVLSKDGIHIINFHKIGERLLNKEGQKLGWRKVVGVDEHTAHRITPTDELLLMLKSDIQRKHDKKSPFFNIVTQVNKKSNDKMRIVQNLLKDNVFIEYIKREKNYSTDDNRNYNDEDVQKLLGQWKDAQGKKQPGIILGYISTLNRNRSVESVSNIATYINSLWINDIVELKNMDKSWWIQQIKDIYKKAYIISEEGVE